VIGLLIAVGGGVLLLNQKIKASVERVKSDRDAFGDEPDDCFDEDNDRPRGRRR